jgi:hypothetical protein
MPESLLFLRHGLPTYRTWLRELTRQQGALVAEIFLERVQAKYLELFAGSERYSQRVLQKIHFEKNILPAIAAYKILLMDGNNPDEAQATLDSLLEAGVAGQKRLYRFWGRFPFFFDMLKWILKPLTLLQYPEAGWRMEFPNLGSDVVALDSHACFYLQVLTEYGVPELTRHFCRLDDLLFEGVTPHVRFERTQTMGRGGSMCDFRYYRVKAG